MSNTISLFREKALDTVKDHVAASTEEREHLITLQAREKFGSILSTAESSLNTAQQGSGRFSFMKPVHQLIQKAADKIKQKKEKNQENIENEKEAVAWSTIERIGTGQIMKATLTAEAVAEGVVAGSKLCNSFSSERSPKPAKSDSIFKWPKILKNIKLPDLHLPNLPSLPRFSSKNNQDSFSVRYPDISFPELPELGLSPIMPDLTLPTLSVPTLPQIPQTVLPQIPDLTFPTLSVPTLPQIPDVTLPSIVSKAKEKIVEKAINKIVDKAVEKEKALIEQSLLDPQKDKIKVLQDKLEENYGKEPQELLDAGRVIVNHRTARYREKIASIYDQVQSDVRRIHHYTIQNLCCLPLADT